MNIIIRPDIYFFVDLDGRGNYFGQLKTNKVISCPLYSKDIARKMLKFFDKVCALSREEVAGVEAGIDSSGLPVNNPVKDPPIIKWLEKTTPVAFFGIKVVGPAELARKHLWPLEEEEEEEEEDVV